ncbi:MAG TPA: hypothetical protein PLJ32_04845 [Kiritimatiellia bacterium]|nr:hypothetical protein [Kiritimatiellia bacterium]
MTNLTRMTFAVAAFAVVMCAGAAVQKSWTGGDGCVSDPTKWSGGAVPTAGQQAVFSGTGSYTVSYPDGNWTNPFSLLLNVASGQTVTLDGRGTIYTSPDSETDGAWEAEPFVFRVANADTLKIENWWGPDKNTKRLGPVAMQNFKIRVGDAACPRDIHFDEGTFNFYNPNGTALENRVSIFGSASEYTRQHVVFHAGTESHLPGLATIGNGTEEDVLRYEGGTHTITGAISMPYDHRGAKCGEQRVEVTGTGTRLTMTGVGSFCVGEGNHAGRTWRLVASDGGTLAFGAGADVFLQAAGTALLCATNGGCIEVATPLYMGTANSTITTCVHLVDAEMRATAAVTVGEVSGKGAATFAATNAKVSLASFYVANGAENPATVFGQNTAWSVDRFLLGYRNSAGAGTVTLDGGSWSNATEVFAVGYNGSPTAEPTFTATNVAFFTTNIFVSGSAAYPARLHLKDCSWVATGDIAVGHGGTAEMIIDGGTQTFACVHPVNHTKGSCTVTVRASIGGANGSGRGTLRLRGADRVTTFGTEGGEFYVGNETGSEGWVHHEAGTTYIGTATSAITVWLSSRGTSYFGVTGGTVRCYSQFNTARGNAAIGVSGGRLYATAINLGNSDTTQNPVQTFTITGGEVETGTFSVANKNNPATENVVLNGGVLKVNELKGGPGAGENGGAATANVTADGGTIQAKASGYYLIRGFDSFKLGAAGLTINTAVDTTVSQDMTSMDGVHGRLIKTGVGTLTLTGTIADDVTVEVREGKVVFAASNEIGALTIGGEKTGGAIEIADGQTLTVKGDVTIVRDVTVGDVTLVKDEITGVTTVTVETSATPETLQLRLDQGTSNATENITFKGVDTLEAVVGTGADLTLSGKTQRGAFVKNGPGAFHLTNADNLFVSGVTLNGGLLEATPPAAMGLDYANTTTLMMMTDGTLAFGANGGVEHVVNTKPTLNASTPTNALVIRTDSDVTFARGVDLTAGAIIKTGAGRMTVNATPNARYSTGNGRNRISNTPSYTSPVMFDAFGTAPTDGYAGFNVAEGAFTFKGTGSETIYIQNAIMVGLYTTSVAAEPELTFDKLSVDTKASGHLTMFGANHRTNAFTARPKIRLVNGTHMRADTLCFGWNSSGSVEGELYIDNATLFNTFAFYMNFSESSGAKLHLIATNHAAVYCSGEAEPAADQGHSAWSGYVDAHFHDSLMAGSKALRGCKFGPHRNLNFDRGAFTFHKGGKLYLEEFRNVASPLGMSTLRFDGGEFVITTNLFMPSNPGSLTVDVTTNGVTMPVADGKTVTIQKRITGAGGVVKTGAGMLVFGKQEDTLPTWAFDGVAVVSEGVLAVLAGGSTNTAACRVEAGATLDVASGAAMARVSGAGTVTGELNGATVALDGEGVLTLDCALTGTMEADFGRTAETAFTYPYPKNVVVANRATGPLGNWRATGLGDGMLSGTFRLEDGKILCDVKSTGFLLLFR